MNTIKNKETLEYKSEEILILTAQVNAYSEKVDEETRALIESENFKMIIHH